MAALAVLADRSEPACERLAVERPPASTVPASGRARRRRRRRSPARVDGARAEPDAGPVALADPADAHDEPQRRRRGTPDWSGCATMLGLHSDAASMAYSWVKVAPSSSQRSSAEVGVGVEPVGDPVGVVAEGAGEVAVAAAEPARRGRRARGRTSSSSRARILRRRRRTRVTRSPADDLLAGDEQLGDDPRGVGRSRPALRRERRRSRRRRRAGGRAGAWTISASVDSAPWLRLAPVASRPS